MTETLRIATRGSELALWQAHYVQRELQRHHPGLAIELVIVKTQGDEIQDRPLHEIGGKGLFVKAIEAKLIDRSCAIAVHSMKDLPAELEDELVIAATPEREDPRDALCGPPGVGLAELAAGTRVGTGSLRRAALAIRENAAIDLRPLRGNVPTRLRKVDSGELDAVILAAAGLKRLGLADRITQIIEPARFCPSPTQGILALQCRADDARARELLGALDHAETAVRARAERAFLSRLQAGCTVPVGCFATTDGDTLTVTGVVVGKGGRPYYEATKQGPRSDAAALGTTLAEALLDLGADEILRVS